MLHRDLIGRRDRGGDATAKDRIVVALLWKDDTGAGTSINDLAADLDPDRFEVIFVFGGSRGAACDRLEASHRVFCLPKWGSGGAYRPSRLRQLAGILRTEHVDVLHCHNHKANLLGTLASALAGTPVTLVQFHGLRRTRGLRRKLENLLIFRRAARIVGVAEAVTQDIVRTNLYVPRERLFVLENSVDYDRFARPGAPKAQACGMLGVPGDATVFGTIGRLTPTKGLPYLLEAFGRVKRQIPAAHLVLLGDGHDREMLERQAANASYHDAVHFLGYRPNVEQLLGGMDVFVLSSVAEGMPRVILEAMAAGVPCVSTAVGGIPEMLDHGRLGRLAPPRDAGALARAMVEMASLPQPQRQSLIEQARQYVRTRYSHDVIRAKLAGLYEQEFMAWRTRNG